MANEEMRFEEAMAALEELVARLEAGKVGLDESLALYEQGMRLVRLCNAQLDRAQQRVAAVRMTEEGLVTEPFDGAKA
ncbi:MAG: exodeoxyribonuclease VII small subunit [Clostridia bacterium]|nr:exodeoxyribonuclease VII small subunit [Clostridia bacterium]